MRSLLAIGLVVLASPAFAASCPFVNDGGDRVYFADGDSKVRIVLSDGSPLACTWGVTGEPAPYQDIACDNGTRAGFFFGSAVRNGTERDLMIFGEDIYYKDCSVPDAGV